MNAPITPTESAALTIAPRQQFDLSPQTFEQALTFSQYLADSDMVPKAYRGKPGDCLIAMQWGYEVGLKPLQALQSIATINGKPGVYGDAGKAILLSKGCIIEEDDIAIVEQNQRARCKISRPGRPPVERTFSLDNAKTAGLWNKEGPWRSYPWRQMAWRAFWFAARDAASDLLRGLPGMEELADMTNIPAERHMGAADVVGAPPPPPAGPPAWPDESLNARKVKVPEWQKAGKTAEDVIAFLATKGALSDEQKARVRGWFEPAQQAQDVTPKVTYATLADRLHKCDDADAASLILDEGRALPTDQQQELAAIYTAKFQPQG